MGSYPQKTRFLALALAALALGLSWATLGCQRSRNPFDISHVIPTPTQTPTNTPTPGPNQLIWANGSAGTFCGLPISLSKDTSMVNLAVVSTTDTISGDTQVLEVGTAYVYADPGITFGVPMQKGMTSYYASGHIQFNLRILQARPSWYVVYGGASWTYISFGLASPGGWSHVSLPFASYTPDSTGSVDLPLHITFDHYSYGPTGSIYQISHIQWTDN